MSNDVVQMNKEIEKFIRKIKSKSISHFDIPEEFRTNLSIIIAERKVGLRKAIRRGYDVINNNFFVIEAIGDNESKVVTTTFDGFDEYFEFLDGDIYQEACYYKYVFSQEEIDKYSINIKRINYKSLLSYSINDYTLTHSPKDDENANCAVLIRKWIAKFNDCNNYNEFISLYEDFKKSKYFGDYKECVLYSFIFHNKVKAYDIMMPFVYHNDSKYSNMLRSMFLIYGSQDIMNYKIDGNILEEIGFKNNVEKILKDLEDEETNFEYKGKFDTKSQMYIYHYIGRNRYTHRLIAEYYRYFESFEDFSTFLNNDLSFCDLTYAPISGLDLSRYTIKENTRLPVSCYDNISYKVRKVYDRFKQIFIVIQEWFDDKENIINSYENKFTYFHNFVYFLNNDLSNADMLFCDGLVNMPDFDDLNLSGAILKSNILERLGVKYKHIKIVADECCDTEEKSVINEEIMPIDDIYDFDFNNVQKSKKIYYVTDLHLPHRIKNAKCQSNEDVKYTIQKIIDNMLENIGWRSVLIIGGDVSSDFNLYKLFVRMLRKSIDEKKKSIIIVFTLGNHELWEFDGYSLDNIINQYNNVIKRNKMYLLQNNIFYIDDNNVNNKIGSINTNEILSMDKNKLRNLLRRARVVLFGGIGFAGYNEEFNANKLIYRNTINRQQELEESKKIEDLYHKVSSDLFDRKVIILTHMPFNDWCADREFCRGFIYVNGHTHCNNFHDDGEIRIYADNQIGYRQETVSLKYFYYDVTYDIFSDYNDGIYEITSNDYKDFYCGKKLSMTFNRKDYKLFMLKKNGFYMFITKSKNGSLCILNGGRLTALNIGISASRWRDVDYFYENMDRYIEYINPQFTEYSKKQKEIAKIIKQIGGRGTIHGCIIDIDFYNHIYVNPTDGKITAYFAEDMVEKEIYSNIGLMLRSCNPSFYVKYNELIEKDQQAKMLLKSSRKTELESQIYLETDIYKASRVISKMQKLESNIISTWIDPPNTIPKLN